MDELVQLLIPPILGAFIGYITNYLAIKMLFRPYEEKRIFGVKIPFTPGLIPKRRKEIAISLAKTIEKHLFTPEKLHKLFEESGYKERLQKRIEIVLDQLIDDIMEDIRDTIKSGISLGKINIKTTLIATALEKALEKLSENLKEKLKEKLLEKASDNIEKNIEEELPQILSQLNVEKMVVDTLMEMDIQTLEEIVIGFSEKQLKHITYTGAVLGFLIGLLQSILYLLH
ncbi:DUF445 family protein [Persephonella sp. KM09-Lau-8]|uniref:DUF445 domain-containing protein n=1 Tax=Persephonella sp. KM09-Lau-8 TaxID=1158345 RepID=UPI000494F0FF|nr:DUF445 family protein [Persephonella sp. KM09-Lau-8]